MKVIGLWLLLCARIREGVEKLGSVWEARIGGRASAEMVDESEVDFSAENSEFAETGGNGTELERGARDGGAEGLVRERITGHGSRSSYRLSITLRITESPFE
jgi:hypothetical protein